MKRENPMITDMREADAAAGGTYSNADFKMSAKALQAIQWSNKRINIFEGAVRSSKTVSANIRWYLHLCQSTSMEFLITGKTEATVYRNIVAGDYGLMGLFGPSNVVWKQSDKGGTRLMVRVQELASRRLVWKTCYVVGANDNSSETKIRGMTVGGWYGDEITIHPDSMVKQGILRCSLPGAKIFWTTNPDSPYCPIYTDYIVPAKQKGYAVFHFTLRDNLALTEDYIKTIENAYQGVWRERMVEGKWVLADGLVYPNFSDMPINEGGNIITDRSQLPKFLYHGIGVDYGQANATGFLLFGYGVDGNYYLLREYYHSGRDAEANKEDQKAPSDYARDFLEFATQKDDDGYVIANKLKRTYQDPAAKGFLIECRKYIKEGVNRDDIYSTFRYADNDVQTGIQVMGSLIGGGPSNLPRHFFVFKRYCPNFMREIGTYSWNAKISERTGHDQVLKEHDHLMDAARYLVYNFEKFVRYNNKQQGLLKAKQERRAHNRLRD